MSNTETFDDIIEELAEPKEIDSMEEQDSAKSKKKSSKLSSKKNFILNGKSVLLSSVFVSALCGGYLYHQGILDEYTIKGFFGVNSLSQPNSSKNTYSNTNSRIQSNDSMVNGSEVLNGELKITQPKYIGVDELERFGRQIRRDINDLASEMVTREELKGLQRDITLTKSALENVGDRQNALVDKLNSMNLEVDGNLTPEQAETLSTLNEFKASMGDALRLIDSIKDYESKLNATEKLAKQ